MHLFCLFQFCGYFGIFAITFLYTNTIKAHLIDLNISVIMSENPIVETVAYFRVSLSRANKYISILNNKYQL